jgi:hypothetical protein
LAYRLTLLHQNVEATMPYNAKPSPRNQQPHILFQR